MFITIVILLVILLLFLYYGTRKPKNFPPGPSRLPLLGYLPYLDHRSTHKTLLSLSKDYGEIVGIYLGTQPAVVVNSYEAIKAVLFHDDLQGRPAGDFIEDRTWGKTLGVIFTTGDVWKSQRRFALHQFRNFGFGKKSHEAVILDDLADMIQQISNIKGPFKLQPAIGVSAINVLWAIMGGTRFNRDDPRLEALVNKINLLFQSGKPFGNISLIFPFLKYVIPEWSGYNTVLRGFHSVRDFIMESIKEHKKTFDENNIKDFIDSYLLEINNSQDSSFTEEQLVAVSMDIFAAGVETSSSLVTFCIMYMCLYPDIQEKVHQELDQVIGTDRLPTMNDRPNLTYTDAVFTEVFRIRSPAPLTVPHIAVKDTTCMGYNIPAKTTFFVNLYSLTVDPLYWEDPHVFRPDRFIKGSKVKKDDVFFPFGKGKRACLGESLARMTTFLTYTSLLQNFTFSFDPKTPVTDTEGATGFTLSPPDFNIIATPRL